MKKLVILMSLVFLFFTSSISVYAYNEQVKDDFLENENQFIMYNETLKAENNEKLIPVTAIRKVGDVYEVTFQYEIVHTKNYELDIAVSNLHITNKSISEERLSEIFTFDITKSLPESHQINKGIFQSSLEGENTIVTITITMAEPNSKTEFLNISGNQLFFDVIFTIHK